MKKGILELEKVFSGLLNLGYFNRKKTKLNLYIKES